MLSIKRGENAIIRRDVYSTTGLLLLSALVSAQVEIIWNKKVLATYTYPSTYLRQGNTTSELELEINSTLSATFRSNSTIEAKWTLVKTNAEFAGGQQTDIIEESIIIVE